MRTLRSTREKLLLALGLVALLCAGLHQAAAGTQPSFDRGGLSKRQPQLLARALAQLQATPAGRPQTYFVGFAGYGPEAVFKREVIAVRRLFDERFGTRGRSIALINHASTAAEVPLATAANLEAALKHVGKLMAPERDTLFLFLSSHGLAGRLDVEMPGLALRPLRPEALRGMLDRSGIQQRVIVVSSCHSGSFIPALAGPTTLIITAARADRTSFGCDDRRRWTYFGDAFFNRALREETSFRKAFDRAGQLIAAWEARDRLTPSLPQIAGGEALTSAD